MRFFLRDSEALRASASMPSTRTAVPRRRVPQRFPPPSSASMTCRRPRASADLSHAQAARAGAGDRAHGFGQVDHARAAMVNHLQRQSNPDHIITIEDPIEFVHECEEVPGQPARGGSATRSAFSEALRSALREDPDMRTGRRNARPGDHSPRPHRGRNRPPGVRHACTPSSAAKTIDRIVDVFPGDEKDMVRSMLSESLQRGDLADAAQDARSAAAAWRRTRS